MGASLFGGGKTTQKSSSDQTQHSITDATSNTIQNALSNTTQAASQTGGNVTDTQQNQDPWKYSVPYILQALQGASDIYGAQKGTPFYQGDLYASLNPEQRTALSNLNNYASGEGTSIADILKSTGTGTIGGLNQASGAANNIIGSALSDPTQAIIASAGQYANNPYTQGMIKSAITPIEQQLRENDIPGLNAAASGTGNTDSSRAGVVEAILRRNAGTQEANVASDILGKQYSSGLDLASALRNSGFGAANSALGSLADIGRTGAGLIGQGYQTDLNNLNIPLTSGNIEQQNQQGQLTADYQKWLGSQSYPWESLNNYWNIVSKPVGSTTTGSNVGTTYQNSMANSNTTSSQTSDTVAKQIMDALAHTDSTSTTQQPGPGILGGILGLASGVGSFFAPGGIAGQIGSFFK